MVAGRDDRISSDRSGVQKACMDVKYPEGAASRAARAFQILLGAVLARSAQLREANIVRSLGASEACHTQEVHPGQLSWVKPPAELVITLWPEEPKGHSVLLHVSLPLAHTLWRPRGKHVFLPMECYLNIDQAQMCVSNAIGELNSHLHGHNTCKLG